MSTDYAPMKKIKFADIFDGRMARFGVREQFAEGKSSESEHHLTDGRNSLSLYAGEDGNLSVVTRCGGNAPGKILSAIAEAFDTDIVSEYEPQFWGFDTEEEWQAWHEKMAREDADKFHAELLKYLRGEPNDIREGTNGMTMAKITEQLVADDPELCLPENKDRLREAIDTIYQRDHAVVVTLNAEDLAAVKMAITHEDDLPSA